MRVDRAYKGVIEEPVILSDDYGSCGGPDLKVGEQYLIYTRRFEDQDLPSSSCMGSRNVENAAEDPTFSALGAGWTVGGLEKIIPVTGGVILDEGSGAVALFTGSFGSGGGTYTSPAGTFSTLVLNSGGTSYTLTETDGTTENFNSSGLETTSVDRNGLTTTFGYSGSLLQTITDPFSEITTFTYSSGKLQSIKDPAGRLTTFTQSGGDLTAVEYPDDSTWDYAYDNALRLTTIMQSIGGTAGPEVTMTYDPAGLLTTGRLHHKS